MSQGQLFYLMGASGAGKDSLINYARHHLNDPTHLKFVRRQITRPTKPGDSNNDDYISPAEFERQQTSRNFVLDWKRHGIRYGITSKIDLWLREDCQVIINGSRHYYETALKTYPELHAIWITANPVNLRYRLQKRGRETPAKIEERMQATVSFSLPKITANNKISIIENNGSLNEAGEQFVRLLLQSNR